MQDQFSYPCPYQTWFYTNKKPLLSFFKKHIFYQNILIEIVHVSLAYLITLLIFYKWEDSYNILTYRNIT